MARSSLVIVPRMDAQAPRNARTPLTSPFTSSFTTPFTSRRARGFTLVELMIVVVIIGVLSAIAIPQYQRYRDRVRQSEAKINLSNIYTLEASWVGENGTYTLCIAELGFNIAVGPQYYSVGWGFGGQNSSRCGPSGGSRCYAYIYNSTAGDTLCAIPDTVFFANATVNSAYSQNWFAPGFGNADYTAMTQTQYVAEARGNVSTDDVDDIWIIDQNRSLTNLGSVQNGVF